jgi:hypothetical protein
LARLALGLVATTRPCLLLPSRTDPTSAERVVVRILGARYLAQSAGGIVVRRPWVPRVDAAIDLTHAATMLALAAADRRHRRPALLSAGVATGFAVADLRERDPA